MAPSCRVTTSASVARVAFEMGLSGHVAASLCVQAMDEFIKLQRFESFTLEFVMRRIKSNFYVTESTSHKNKVFYFRYEDWGVMTQNTWKKLGQSTFRVVKERESQILQHRHLSFSHLRLLPKPASTTFRPITNLRRRILPRNATKLEARYAQSINSILQNAFQVLRYEAQQGGGVGEAGVNGVGEVLGRLKGLKGRMGRVRPQQLYFVKADIVACFDSIDQGMLMEILREIVKEEEYLVQKYSVTFASVGKVKRQFVRRAKTGDDFVPFVTLAKQLAGTLRNAILTDGLSLFEDREPILELLEEHICHNLVKMGKKFYEQITGIPQGSVLSSLLCSFFLSHMERHKLRHLVTRNDLLLRLVDDFLFVTPDREKAVAFVRLLHEGIAEYGCSVNPAKTVVNFDLVDCGVKLKRVQELNSLKSATDISESLTIEYSRKPWVALQLKMFHYIIPKCQPLFLDTTLNSESIVLLNIYQNFLVCAMKLYCHIQSMVRVGHCRVPSAEFLLDIVQMTIKYTKGLVYNRGRTNVVGSQCCKVALCNLKVEW
ncbi:hypothetical protein HDU98_008580 [Podochytrium sp. JEL0797]|nr:hypothetical protein HDU98_008580 [Podochytrium sp. JEL0797]